MLKKLHKFIIAVITVCLALQYSTLAFAGFSMVPTNSEARRQFNFELKPGVVKNDSVVIQNNNSTPLTLLLYGADATHSNLGSFALVNRTSDQRTVGKWVKFNETTVTLNGGESRAIPFSISIPKDATPGNYGGGIAAETTTIQSSTKDQKGATGAGVVISSRLVVKLFISIPGDKKVSYNWTDLVHSQTASGHQRFTFSYQNSGNAVISAEPKVEVTSFPPFYDETIKGQATNLLQGEKVSIPLDCEKKPIFGIFTVKATTTFSEYDIANNTNINSKTETRTITYVIIPWNIVGWILAVIAVVAGFVIYKKMDMAKLVKSCRDYQVQSGDTLISLAQKANLNWKKLAKLNKLKPPYSIEPGQTLKVPAGRTTIK